MPLPEQAGSKRSKSPFPSTKERGDAAETLACGYLERLGFRIVARNFRLKMGELDIVALKEGIVHIVEVKSGIGYEPVYNLSPAKMTKLIRTAQAFVTSRYPDFPFVLDAVIVREGACELLENITF